MSLMKFSVKHDKTLDEAKQVLQQTVDDVNKHFGLLINSFDWNTDRTDVKIDAKGADIHVWVDTLEVHLTCDVPLLSKLLGGPVVEKLKGLVQDRFQKKLTEEPKA
jgi:predicted secreted protein